MDHFTVVGQLGIQQLEMVFEQVVFYDAIVTANSPCHVSFARRNGFVVNGPFKRKIFQRPHWHAIIAFIIEGVMACPTIFISPPNVPRRGYFGSDSLYGDCFSFFPRN